MVRPIVFLRSESAVNPPVVAHVEIDFGVALAGFGEPVASFGPVTIPKTASMMISCEKKIVARLFFLSFYVLGVLGLKRVAIGLHSLQRLRSQVIEAVVEVQILAALRRRFIGRGPEGSGDVGFQKGVHDYPSTSF